ncbi:hypothetical protein HID58_062449 [Brassica napus]|uniref:Uncharacterized protein n=1 Tax=Brassica napus TaxID=3708 RepID=A0ABQ8A1L7_BRANA|nr:hypothetical protein HID58_062449 [Brassica napus]
MFGSDGVSSAGTNWNQRVFVSSGPPVRRDRSVIALGALDLLLVADCAWIWVKSKIRDPTEASTSRAVSLLLRRLAPAAELRGVNQALPSMPARSHFGEARSNLP